MIARMHFLRLAFAALLSLWLFGLAVPGSGPWATAHAQEAAPTTLAEPTVDLAALRQALEKQPPTAETGEEARTLLAALAHIGQQAQTFITARTAQLNDLNARLGELGNVPAAGSTEDPDITRQRATLVRERNGVDADIRLARLVMVDAQQRTTEIRGQQRALFEARLAARAPSPLGRVFWRDLSLSWNADVQRLQPLTSELRSAWALASAPPHRTPLLWTALLVLAAVTVGNLLAERALVSLAQRLLPGGRLRRSLLIVAMVMTNLFIVALSLWVLLQQLEARELLGPLSQKLLRSADESLLFMVFVASLGRALLANGRPSWRLPPIPDGLAKRLAPFPWLTALISALVWLPSQINALVDASFAAILTTHAFTATALVLLIGAMLLCLREPAAAVAATPPADASAAPAPALPERPLWIALLVGAVSLALVIILALVAMGYVALASLAAGQLTWTGVVAAAFYVLFKGADDLFMAMVSARSSLGQRLQASFGFAPATLDQAAVVLSALARVALFFYMVIALIAPLGTGPGEVFERAGQFGTGLKIGEFQIVPAALFTAIGVAVAGFVALRVFKRWMRDSYLPTTAMEEGMQTSLTTLLGYAGVIIVVALALSALGIGVNRIAWIASALSVGIGFGLQAIVQNFISGLILLAERPVKVGDWVVLGTTEGDVKRINVRATEIQLGDRSTLIVPNSEFITKSVRNMTLTNAEGRVLIRLPMPLNTDAHQVRDLMLAACAAHPGVLQAPAPSLSLEGIENGMLIFQAIAYVSSPRVAGGVRSDLLFTMLDEFKKAGLPLATPAPVADVRPPEPRPV
ncbi:MAG: mechanosensitive ion channel family protein [Comamonadaceae bacterium]|nr:MAG: mechanosensitive ion channel family protein [Comamonadaceae bacterium]